MKNNDDVAIEQRIIAIVLEIVLAGLYAVGILTPYTGVVGISTIIAAFLSMIVAGRQGSERLPWMQLNLVCAVLSTLPLLGAVFRIIGLVISTFNTATYVKP